jgi:hypothetical protein
MSAMSGWWRMTTIDHLFLNSDIFKCHMDKYFSITDSSIWDTVYINSGSAYIFVDGLFRVNPLALTYGMLISLRAPDLVKHIIGSLLFLFNEKYPVLSGCGVISGCVSSDDCERLDVQPNWLVSFEWTL